MNKIKSLDDLRKLKQSLESGMNIREMSNSPESVVQIRVAMGTCGIFAGARNVMNVMIEKIDRENIQAVVTQGGCMGFCSSEPTVEVKIPGKDPVIFGNVDPARAAEILDTYVGRGEMPEGVMPANQTINP